MSERLTDEELVAIKRRQIAALREAGSLTGGQRVWTLSTPSQNTDSDLVIGHALNDIVVLTTVYEALLAEVKALKTDNEFLRKRIAALEQPRESMLEQARRVLRSVNTAAGQEGD